MLHTPSLSGALPAQALGGRARSAAGTSALFVAVLLPSQTGAFDERPPTPSPPSPPSGDEGGEGELDPKPPPKLWLLTGAQLPTARGVKPGESDDSPETE